MTGENGEGTLGEGLLFRKKEALPPDPHPRKTRKMILHSIAAALFDAVAVVATAQREG